MVVAGMEERVVSEVLAVVEAEIQVATQLAQQAQETKVILEAPTHFTAVEEVAEQVVVVAQP